MARLWQDIRAAYVAECLDGGVRVLDTAERQSPRGFDIPLECLTNQPRRPKRKPAGISDKLRWAIWERDNFTCKWCGSRRFLAVDHIYPQSLGGQTVPKNLQTLCRPCNSKKSNRVII